MLEQIAAAVARNESLGEYELHVIMSPFAGYDTVATKTLVSLIARDRSERVFVKISNSERLSRFLQVEAESIDECSALGVKGIPRVLARGSIEGRYFLAQKYVPWSTLHGRLSYLDEAVTKTRGWLASLYEKTRRPLVEPAELIQRARDYAKPAMDFSNWTTA